MDNPTLAKMYLPNQSVRAKCLKCGRALKLGERPEPHNLRKRCTYKICRAFAPPFQLTPGRMSFRKQIPTAQPFATIRSADQTSLDFGMDRKTVAKAHKCIRSALTIDREKAHDSIRYPDGCVLEANESGIAYKASYLGGQEIYTARIVIGVMQRGGINTIYLSDAGERKTSGAKRPLKCRISHGEVYGFRISSTWLKGGLRYTQTGIG